MPTAPPSRFTPRVRLAVWVVVICVLVVPWSDLQDHSHWARVQWIPFVTPPVKLVDIAVNVLLYLPFGYWFSRQSRHRTPWRRAVFYALILSTVTEWTQLYSHSRFPSMTDVSCNMLGAGFGSWGLSRTARADQSQSP